MSAAVFNNQYQSTSALSVVPTQNLSYSTQILANSTMQGGQQQEHIQQTSQTLQAQQLQKAWSFQAEQNQQQQQPKEQLYQSQARYSYPVQSTAAFEQRTEHELREEEFERLMSEKQNEIEYLKDRQLKSHKQVEETNREVDQLGISLELARARLKNENVNLNDLIAGTHELDLQILDLQFRLEQNQVQQQYIQPAIQEDTVKRAHKENQIIDENSRKLHKNIFKEEFIASPAQRPEEEDVLLAQTEMINRQQEHINFQDKLINDKELLIGSLRGQIQALQLNKRQSSHFCC